MDTLSQIQSHGESCLSEFTPPEEFGRILLDWVETLPQSPSGVLDVGAGQGHDAGFLAQHGTRCLALDPSEVLIKNTYAGEAIVGTAERMGLASLSFGGVIIKDCLTFLSPDQRERALGEASRVLVETGRLLVLSEIRTISRARFIDKDQRFPECLRSSDYPTHEHWLQAIASLSPSATVFAIEYTITHQDLSEIAQSAGLHLEQTTIYPPTSSLVRERLWPKFPCFISHYRK